MVLGLGAVAAAGYATRGAWLPSVRGVIYDTASAAYRALLAPTAMDLDDDNPPAGPPAGKAEAQAAVEEPPTKVDLETVLENLEAARRQIDGLLAVRLGPGLEAEEDALKTALKDLEAEGRKLEKVAGRLEAEGARAALRDAADRESESSEGGSGSRSSSGPPELLGGSDSESESDGSVPSLASDSEDELEAQEAPQAASQEEQGPPRGHADWRDWEALPATVLAVVARKIAAATDASHRRRPKTIILEAGSVDNTSAVVMCFHLPRAS